MNMTKWITVKTFAPHVEMTKDQIYRLIRGGRKHLQRSVRRFSPLDLSGSAGKSELMPPVRGFFQRVKIVKRKHKTKRRRGRRA